MEKTNRLEALGKVNLLVVMILISVFTVVFSSINVSGFVSGISVENYTLTPDDYFSWGGNLGYKLGQRFTVGYSGHFEYFDLVGMSLLLFKEGAAPPSICGACIMTGGNSTYMGNILSCNNTINVTGITTSTAGQWFNITLPGAKLTPGESYWINASVCDSDQLRWKGDISSPTYGGGNSYVKYFGGFDNDLDFNFIVYGNQTGINYIIRNTTYNNITSSMSNEQFTLNLSYDSRYYLLTNSYLVYNHTNYSTSIIGSSNHVILSANVVNDPYFTQKNLSFYWLVGLTNSTGTFYYNTSVLNVTVNPLSIDDCTVNKNVIINLTNYDQDTLLPLTSSTFNVQLTMGNYNLNNYFTYYNNFSNVNSAAICINNISTSFRMDAVIQTTKSGQYSQFYNLQNYTVNNQTINQNISIKLLNSSSGYPFKINVKDYSYNPISGVLVEIDRQYVNLGNFQAVEIPLTDSQGLTIGHFVLNNQLYNIYIKYNGRVLGSFLNQQVYCNPLIGDCVIDLNLKENVVSPTSGYGESGSYASNQDYNDSTRTYSFDFNTIDGSPATIVITGTILNNYQNVTVCSTTSFASSGTLSCIIPESSGNSTIYFKATSNNKLLFTDTVTPNSFPQSFLTPVKYIIAALLIPMLVLIGGSSASVALILFIIGLIMSALLFIGGDSNMLGATSFITFFIIAAGLLIIKIVKGGIKNG